MIGHPVGHSWSAQWFTKRFEQVGLEAEYSLYDIAPIHINKIAWLGLDGFNVTIPYKQVIIPYLDEIDETALAIGAVNVVARSEKGMKGYNTDWIGFRDSIKPLLKETDKRALVFGSGGAAKAVEYALRKLGIEPQIVSRKGPFRYQDVTAEVLRDYTVLVNCTPLGMAGEWEGKKVNIPYEALSKEHLLYDCVYNPVETAFLKAGKEQGAERLKNGEEMLFRQAEEAWKYWIIDK